MATDHDKLQIITGEIVETARKDAGMTQGELADASGVIQSTISRIEQGVLAPTLFHWLQISKILNIPEEALNIGYLDRNSTTKINSGIKEGGYTLPKAYGDLKCIKVRNYLPLFNYIRDEFGEETLKAIFADLKMKSTFFLNLDNQVNLNFPDDFLNTLGKYQKVDGRTLGRTLKYVASPDSHGVLARLFRNASDQLDLMDRYLKNITKYHRFFFLDNYKIGNNKITFEAKYPPEIQFIFDEMGAEKDEFLWQFYLSWMKKFSLFDYKNKLGTHKEVIIESTDRDKDGIRRVTITTS
jgi:transcriptional regulator with XRE-family HTH domain